MEESTTGKRENPDQIPQENDTMGKTGKVISEQAGVQGQRKEVNVESYSKVANLGQILKDMNFPADKNKIIDFAKKQQQQSSAANNKNIENKENVLSALQNLEDREYKNVSDVTTALGLVYQS
jgi:hypothetical protein